MAIYYSINGTYNLSAAATAIMVDGTPLAPSLAGGSLTIYSGRQPYNADTAISGNTVLATVPFPATMFGIYAHREIIVLDPLPQVPWVASETAVWARAKNSAGATMFDCNVGVESDQRDLYIDQNPVRIGDVCGVNHNTPPQIAGRRKTNLGDRIS